jgi:hypothetical protein
MAIYSEPKSFVNFLLPPLSKGRAGVGEKIYDSCKDCYSNPKVFVNFLLPPLDKGRVGVGEKIYDSLRIAIL